MPSGSPELHEYWCSRDLEQGRGDLAAMNHLRARGYRLSNDGKWEWISPVFPPEPSEEALRAINYLCWEWDFGGLGRD